MTADIVNLKQRRNDLFDAVHKIKDIIYGYAGTMSLAEAVGILEIAKIELLEEQKVDR